MRDRLPTMKNLGATGAGPKGDLGPSRRAQEEAALQTLLVRMSRRRVLSAGRELEEEGRALASVTELLHDAEQARLALPKDSSLEGPLISLQKACNAFRTELELKRGYPFGKSLEELRAEALHFAESVYGDFGLGRADALRHTIDPTSAWGPLGQPSRTIYVDGPPSAELGKGD